MPWKVSKTPYTTIATLHTDCNTGIIHTHYHTVIIITLLGSMAWHCIAGFFLTIIFQSWTDVNEFVVLSALICSRLQSQPQHQYHALPTHLNLSNPVFGEVKSVFHWNNLNQQSVNRQQATGRVPSLEVPRCSKNHPAISLSLAPPSVYLVRVDIH